MTTLGELAREGVLEFSDGYRTRRDQHANTGFRILRAGDVRDGRIYPDGPDFVGQGYAAAIGTKAARVGDVVLTTKGTVGRTGRVTDLASQVVYSPQVCFFRSQQPRILDIRFFYYWLSSPQFVDQSGYLKSATDMAPYISLKDLASTVIDLPPVPTQRAIAEVLGALDDKIAANERLRVSCRDLRGASLNGAMRRGSKSVALGESTTVLTRGKAPKYATDESGVLVINQKCVRDGVVSLEPARLSETSREPLLHFGDTLVNSTGQGTLGRVGVWREETTAFADSHVTVVRFDAAKVNPWVGAEALVAAEAQIEAMGEGSTGQTELSRKALSEFAISVPASETQVSLGERLALLHGREHQTVLESRELASLRDTLLPHLMSGRISVREAEKAVEEVL